MDERALHVTNGDAAVFDIARAAGVAPEAVLPWRDVLHDGPVPAGLGAEALARVRAGTSRPVAGRARPRRCCHCSNATRGSPVILRTPRWCSGSRTTSTTRCSSRSSATGSRVAPATSCGCASRTTAAAGSRPRSPRAKPWSPDGAAFAALRSSDPAAWAGAFPFAERLLEELPDARTGLSRLEREILEALAAGPLEGAELFARVAEQEQPPWLGDASVWAAADALAPLTARDDDGARRITAEGEAVLAGRARRPAHEHWVGGVHLVPGEPGWAWDARAGEPVQTG